MNKNIVTMILLLLSAKACSLQGNTCMERLTGSRSEEKDVNSVEAILTELKQKTTQLTSYQAELEYRFKQPLLESETLRKGVLYYQRSNERSMLRVNFQTLKQDDEKERKYAEHFTFDGIWLTRLDYQIKRAERRQMTEPNKPADPFELASRELPIIGFTKIEDLKKQFEINLVQSGQSSTSSVEANRVEGQEKDENQAFFHLRLKVKPDSTYKDDYTGIDFWIDKKLDLPARIIAVTTEEDIYDIKFLKPVVNKKIDAKVFKFDIPKDFTIEINPLKNEETEEF
jgi:outer membrane lipoprotein-sorting protein